MTTSQETRVVRNDDAARYELYVGSELATFADFRQDGATLSIDHVETRDDYRGRGLAGELVGSMLDEAHGHGWRIVPRCSYAASYIADHPEYRDLIA
jgi:hypothetical protein